MEKNAHYEYFYFYTTFTKVVCCRCVKMSRIVCFEKTSGNICKTEMEINLLPLMKKKKLCLGHLIISPFSCIVLKKWSAAPIIRQIFFSSFYDNSSLIFKVNPMLWVLKRIVSLSTHKIGFKGQIRISKHANRPLSRALDRIK